MAKKNNIVTFEEARRSAKRRRPAASGTVSVAEDAVTTKLEEKKPASRKRTRKRATDTAPERAASAPMTARVASASTIGSSRSVAKEAAKQRRSKARAEKKFAKLYGGDGAAASAQSDEGGPRAAVYQTKMGARHRKAAQALQQKAAQGISAASGFVGGITLPDLKALPKRTVRILTVIGCAAFLAFMLYSPAQQCYQQVRERDRVAAEYAAVLDRNQALADSVDMLQTEEGIEDKAHAEYGMVKDGEEAGSVSGIDVQSSTDFVANVVPGGVGAPDTWYSGLLDFLFGYSNPQ